MSAWMVEAHSAHVELEDVWSAAGTRGEPYPMAEVGRFVVAAAGAKRKCDT